MNLGMSSDIDGEGVEDGSGGSGGSGQAGEEPKRPMPKQALHPYLLLGTSEVAGIYRR